MKKSILIFPAFVLFACSAPKIYTAAGFKTVGQKINTKVGAGWVILDVLGGIVPVIIDAATGSWKKLDQDNLNAYLEKEK